MNRWHVALMGIFAVLAVTSTALGTLSNENDTSLKAWQSVENAYQQRTELLGPFVMSALRQDSGSAEVIALATSYDRVKTMSVRTAGETGERTAFLKKQDDLTVALAQLVVARDIYPKLMADPAFKSIHARLDEIESRITQSTAAYTRSLHEQELRKQGLLFKLARFTNAVDAPGPSSIKCGEGAGNGASIARYPSSGPAAASN